MNKDDQIYLTPEKKKADLFDLKFTFPAEQHYFYITVCSPPDNPDTPEETVTPSPDTSGTMTPPDTPGEAATPSSDPPGEMIPPDVAEATISISKKSFFGSEAELKAKRDEADPRKVLFEFRNKIAPDKPIDISRRKKASLELQSNPARIKPVGKKFLIVHRTRFSSQLRLMSPSKSNKEPKEGSYLNLFGLESYKP